MLKANCLSADYGNKQGFQSNFKIRYFRIYVTDESAVVTVSNFNVSKEEYIGDVL